MAETTKFERKLNLGHATILNMIDMVGIGPFITLPVIMVAFPGKFSVIPWVIGAIVALADGFVWGELGSAWPQAGGSYVFLQKLYKGRFGKLMSFLYVLQTSLHLPLVMTSAALGFVSYFNYLVPLGPFSEKLVMVGLVLIIVFLLYRGIKDISKISVVLSIIVVGLLIWTIVTGAMRYDAEVLARHSVLPQEILDLNTMAFWFVIGNYTTQAIYSYLGYYNACHLGGEIKNPHKNIPRSIIISIIGIGILYILMQWMVVGSGEVLTNGEKTPIISHLFEHTYGPFTANIATVLILIVAGSSLFALMLGYSRILYAAARDGMHFKYLDHLHPTRNFPDRVLIIFGIISILFCLVFAKLSTVFKFIVVTRIFIQFIPQAVGVIRLRLKKRMRELHFKMPLYPVIPIFSIIVWVLAFVLSGYNKGENGYHWEYQYYLSGVLIIVVGTVLFFTIFHKTDRDKEE